MTTPFPPDNVKVYGIGELTRAVKELRHRPFVDMTNEVAGRGQQSRIFFRPALHETLLGILSRTKARSSL